MKWYLAKLIFRIICGDGSHTAQFDEQLRLIHAEDDLHAFNKARLIGEREACSEYFIREVQWKFIDVSELHLLHQLADGAEIYARISEEADAALYIRTIKKRGADLFQQGIHQFTQLNSISIGA